MVHIFYTRTLVKKYNTKNIVFFNLRRFFKFTILSRRYSVQVHVCSIVLRVYLRILIYVYIRIVVFDLFAAKTKCKTEKNSCRFQQITKNSTKTYTYYTLTLFPFSISIIYLNPLFEQQFKF